MMVNNITAIIPARGGSKGVPRNNANIGIHEKPIYTTDHQHDHQHQQKQEGARGDTKDHSFLVSPFKGETGEISHPS